ncbi:hypothetical protein CDL12_23445 [Handroanthus impetiginosus]|uniref:Uncharacterized protein n=1 Tax=Handroanthus impetiginosus TaxID=429701 RepID=A0A2G9GG74_9LAMI|nr:hypothetical protein CDL12_23445 [Handroanthus impetiginosus]
MIITCPSKKIWTTTANSSAMRANKKHLNLISTYAQSVQIFYAHTFVLTAQSNRRGRIVVATNMNLFLKIENLTSFVMLLAQLLQIHHMFVQNVPFGFTRLVLPHLCSSTIFIMKSICLFLVSQSLKNLQTSQLVAIFANKK